MENSDSNAALDTKPDNFQDQQPPCGESFPPPAVFETSGVDLQQKLQRHSSQGRRQSAPEAALGPQTIVSTVLALTSGLLSYALVRSNRQHKKRYHKIKSDLMSKQASLAKAHNDLAAKDDDLSRTREEVERLAQQAAALEAERTRRLKVEAELQTLQDNLADKGKELNAAQETHDARLHEVQQLRDQLQQRVGSVTAEAEAERQAAEERYAAAEAARVEAEGRWQQALDELISSKEALEDVKGELGLTRSQMEGLRREVDFTKRELANAQQRLQQAQFESRQRHSDYGADEYPWPE